MPRRPNPVPIRGRVYASVYEAGAELGVSPKTISNAIYNGRLDTVGLGRYREGVPTKIRGRVYPSQTAAAREHGVTQQTVFCALERGSLDRLGMGGAQ